MSNFVANQEVDARGLNCPLPILRAKKALSGLQSGEILKFLIIKYVEVLTNVEEIINYTKHINFSNIYLF